MTITTYNVPHEAEQVLDQLVNDPRLNYPDSVKDAAKHVKYEGDPLPFLAVPFKFTEAISAIKGLEASVVAAIAKQRYGVDAGTATINTDHAALFTFSAFSTTLEGKSPFDPSNRHRLRDCDIRDSHKHPWRRFATNVYKTKDGRFFHLHGSLDARPSLRLIGLDPDRIELTNVEEILKLHGEAVAKWDAKDLDIAANEEYRQAGCVVYPYKEFLQLEAGKAIANSPIYELSRAAEGAPVAWPAPPPATANGVKALSGIKVLELTRIIAGPAIGKGLAQHGATVLRITTRTQPDLQALHPDLSQGKYQADLDLKTEAGRKTLWELVKDADVMIDGYRPGALAKLGFSREAVRGVNPALVYVRENCYGWHGPWQHRSGWQQIADCFVGLTYHMGEKLGLPDGEGVVPIYPNSDYGSGGAGAVGVMHALLLRATQGGTYNVDTSLSYYNVFLMSLGFLPDAVWETIRPVAPIRHNWDLIRMLGVVIPENMARRPDVFSSPKFWQTIDAPAMGGTIRSVTPIVHFSGPVVVESGRPPVQNGDDEAVWPAAA